MNTATRLSVYAVGLALAFGGALGVGTAVGPVAGQSPSVHSAGHGESAGGQMTMPGGDTTPGGLAVSAYGYTLVPAQTTLVGGLPATLQFTITGPDGQPVTRYTREHDKDLHLIVVGRDLSGFQHLHPTMGADGLWTLPLTLPAAGDYRVFADFVPAGAGPLTLGADLHAAGSYVPRPLPAPTRTASVADYTITLTGQLQAGGSSPLTLSVRKYGRPVSDLQPYLGAYGHLVALRTGDLAYLHVHPTGTPGDGQTAPGPDISFAAEVPTAGTYRLYLNFQHDGVVRTAEFTATATGAMSR